MMITTYQVPVKQFFTGIWAYFTFSVILSGVEGATNPLIVSFPNGFRPVRKFNRLCFIGAGWGFFRDWGVDFGADEDICRPRNSIFLLMQPCHTNSQLGMWHFPL